MTIRRPLVLSGQFLSEADDNDGKVILGSIIYGSGLNNQLENYASNYTADIYLPLNASGLIFVLDGSDYKLADDGLDQVSAVAALASGNEALLQVEPASASGLEAQRISVEALASGNAALLAEASGIQQSSAAVTVSYTAIASGDAAYVTASSNIPYLLNTISSGEYALSSGLAANSAAVEAYASGNAALSLVINDPFISDQTLIGLIFALS